MDKLSFFGHPSFRDGLSGLFSRFQKVYLLVDVICESHSLKVQEIWKISEITNFVI